MTEKPGIRAFGELVVKASEEKVLSAIRKVIGPKIKEIEQEGDTRLFSDDVPTCPLRIRLVKLNNTTFRLHVHSLCITPDSLYCESCQGHDERAVQYLYQVLVEKLGDHQVQKGHTWMPERIKDKSRREKVVDRTLKDTK